MLPECDTARCTRYRHHRSTCRACADACPRNAIAVTGRVDIDPARCTGCGACTCACPNEALAGAGDDLAHALPRLRAQPAPVIGCRQVLTGFGDVRMRCFGGLDAPDLAALAILVERPLAFNVAPCTACPAGCDVLPLLQSRLQELAAAGVLGKRPLPILRTDFGEGAESCSGASRRGFLSILTRLIPPSDSDAAEEAQTRQLRRKSAAQRVDESAGRWLLTGISHEPRLTEGCDHCCRCARVCPTGALERTRVEGVKTLEIIADACTGCGLCVQMCPRNAIAVLPSVHPASAGATA